jgi:prepilin-type N-terminal cleavage/methylation domain-containing protein
VRKDAGFSLIELLIVVAIILIIAAIAIPNFMRARIASNEASAVSSSRTINSAQVTYASFYGRGYSSSIAQLGPPPSGTPASADAADLIDDVLATSAKSGYTFEYTPLTGGGSVYTNYELRSRPLVQDRTGSRHFYTDASGVIRVAYGVPAGPSDSPIH